MTTMTIWKYHLEDKVEMPIGAKILDIQMQNNELVIWALVNPDNKTETRFFHSYPTGAVIPGDPGIYLKTLQHGWFVAHYFEGKP